MDALALIFLYACARSLQIGLAVEVIAITSVAANLAAILGGILVFGEPIGSGALDHRPPARVLPSPARCLCPPRYVHAAGPA